MISIIYLFMMMLQTNDIPVSMSGPMPPPAPKVMTDGSQFCITNKNGIVCYTKTNAPKTIPTMTLIWQYGARPSWIVFNVHQNTNVSQPKPWPVGYTTTNLSQKVTNDSKQKFFYVTASNTDLRIESK